MHSLSGARAPLFQCANHVRARNIQDKHRPGYTEGAGQQARKKATYALCLQDVLRCGLHAAVLWHLGVVWEGLQSGLGAS
jgi:hypothetical protein